MANSMRLLDYINTNDSSDTNARIARYLFQNRNTFPTMTITALADATFVTPATISRFVKSFGYPSFSALKADFDRFNKTSAAKLYRVRPETTNAIIHRPGDAFADYGNQIITAIQDTIQTVTPEMLTTLTRALDETNQVMLFGYSSAIRITRALQEGLILADKFTIAGDNLAMQRRLAKELTPDGLAIIISSYGNFFSAASDLFDDILSTNCRTILLTQQRDTFFSAALTDIICINEGAFQEIGSYPTSFFVDFFARYYYFHHQ